MIMLGLSACGGGGSLTQDGSNNGGNTSGTSYTIALTLHDAATDEQVDSSTLLSSAKPLKVKATVTASNGSSVAGQVVAFSFDEENLASFTVQNGRVALDANGQASIGLMVGSTSGAGNVIATFGTTTAQIAFTSAGEGAENRQPANLDLFATSLQLPSSGSDQITITAAVKDSNNSVMEGITVNFAVDSNAALSSSTEVTGADGKASVVLSTGDDPENRLVTVTASVGSASPIISTLEVQIDGSVVVINGPKSVILGDTAPISVSVLDSDGKPVSGKEVTLTAQLGSLNIANPITSEQGVVTGTYQAAASGTDTIVASALNYSESIEIVVGEDSFRFTTLPTDEVYLGTTETVTVTWLKDGAPYANGAMTFVASRGQITNADLTTDANGQASFDIQSSSAGFASISAIGVDSNNEEVSARVEIEFVASTAASIVVDATPDAIGPDGQEATITAVVRDPAGNLVKGKQVRFEVEEVSGGQLSPVLATTDSSGSASTVYTSVGTSELNGVKITATVVDTPSVSAFTTLTVSDRAFDISFGTGNQIQSPNDATYLKEFVVFVSDASGNPVRGEPLSVSIAPPTPTAIAYYKGFWQWDDDLSVWFTVTTASCTSEDGLNDPDEVNGQLDAGEDRNGDGDLTPGIIGVISFEDNVNTTDENGQVILQWRYPKEFAPWVNMVMTVRGQSSGTESQQTQQYRLPVAAADLKDKGASPPANPFGLSGNCADTL
ncbi:hypothetical protein TK45_00130 [Bowmanella sp. JS7-9]|nr:hypothetical protein TK45_00130 [Bowmanella sp. JS7-9]